jgi:Mannosyltransferase (PIG-V)
MPHQQLDALSADVPAVVPHARSFSWPVMRPITLPIEARIVVLALCFRLIGAVVGFVGNVAIPDYQNQGFTVLQRANPFWDRFARWDSGWYYGIAAHGYDYVANGRNNLAFFPVYPKLMGVVGRAFGGAQQDFYFAGILISWLSFAAAMPLLYRLARLDLPHDKALRAVAYAAVFPSAYFFGVVYSEALFLLTLVGAALAFRTQRWFWAGIAAMIMTATRVNGVMFLPALALIGWDAAGESPRAKRLALVASLAGLAGIGGYSLFVYSVSGNPLEWYESITRWGYHPGGNPFNGLIAIATALVTRPFSFIATEPMAPYDTLNALTATAAIVAVPFVWRRLGRGYAAIIVLGLLLPLSSGQFEGLGRYCSVLFPLPILFSSWKGETRHIGLMASFALFYALGQMLFGNVHPMF